MKTIKTLSALIGIFIGISTSGTASAALEASWAHGTSATLEQPTVVTMNKFGWGSRLTLPAGLSGTRGAWVHFSIPTPVIDDGVRVKLAQILLQSRGNGVIDAIHVWDGPSQILAINTFISGDHSAFGTWSTARLATPRSVLFGIGVSVHIVNYCAGTCPAQTVEFPSIGGDFNS